MSWRPWTEILPVVDAGAERAAIVATGGTPPALPLGQSPPLAAPPTQLFRPGLSHEEMHQAQAEEAALAAANEAQRKEAYEEGMALARAEQEALATRYRGAIEDLGYAREQLLSACEADLVRLAMTIAREVLLADVVGQEQYAQRMAEHALQLLQGSPAVVLRMSPKDAAALKQHKPELGRRPDVTLLEDNALAPGGVVAEGSKGRVDATFEARLRAMAEKLLPPSPIQAAP